MEQFIIWYCSEPRLALNRTVVLRFRLYLESLGFASRTVNQRLAAVRRLAYEAADSGLLSPELAAGIRRVKGAKQLGARTGNWLTKIKRNYYWRRPPGGSSQCPRSRDDIRARRLDCAELSSPRLRWRICRSGKDIGPSWTWLAKAVMSVRSLCLLGLSKAIDRWRDLAKVAVGRIFRAVSRHGTPWGKGISENVIWYVVRRCAERTQLDHLAPHDLRRTCPKLCDVNGGELEHIQFLLGHVSVLTTERYLGCKQNLEEPVNDRFGCLFVRASVDLR